MLYSCRVRGRVFFRRRLHRLRGAVRRADGYSYEFPNIRCYLHYFLASSVRVVAFRKYLRSRERLSGVALEYVDYIWYYADIFTVVLIVLGAILGYCYHYGDCGAKSALLRTL